MINNFSEESSTNEVVKIDQAHALLLTGLVVSVKPKSVLEFGFGGERSTLAILQGLQYNSTSYSYTLVDNWVDWNYVPPTQVLNKYSDKLRVVSSNEKDYVYSCKESYDFVMSDGDHHQTDQWFEYVYENLLNEGGVLVYHDVNFAEEQFVNLRKIYETCKTKNLRYALFNKSSLPHERCHRGLLVVFKWVTV